MARDRPAAPQVVAVAVVGACPREAAGRAQPHLIALPVVRVVARLTESGADGADRSPQRRAALPRGAARVVEPVLQIQVPGTLPGAVSAGAHRGPDRRGAAVDRMRERDHGPAAAAPGDDSLS